MLAVAVCGCNALTGLAGNEYDRVPEPGCETGFADCDGRADNGCEAHVDSDENRCGPTCQPCGSAADSYPVCVGGKCGIACNGGFGDCDVDESNGCEVAFDKDPEGCGSCGWSCEGGTCELGRCGSVEIAAVSSGTISGLAVTSDQLLYSSSDGEVGRVSVTGGSALPLVVEPGVQFTGLVAGGGRAYWFSSPEGEFYECISSLPGTVSDLRMVPIEGGEAPVLDQSSACFEALAADDAFVFTNATGYDGMSYFHELRRVDPSAASPPLVWVLPAEGDFFFDTTPQPFAMDDNSIFWIAGYLLHTAPRNFAGAPTVLARGVNGPLVVDETDIFFLKSNAIRRMPKAGGRMLQVATASTQVLAVDADSVFWSSNGAVVRAGKDGSNATVLLQAAPASHLVVGAGRLFYASNNAVYKLVLPAL